jgi:uncharacterized protein
MKKVVLTLFVISILMGKIYTQNTTIFANKGYIEINGVGETEITPDEIYVTITLQERPENREKLGIEKQEEGLKSGIKDLGIELINLSLVSAEVDYRKMKSIKKDAIITKTYTLKIATAEMLNKVYQKLDKINAFDAYVSKVTHSKIQQFTKENRIKAIKAAKEKVDYLLDALNQKAGQALQINEVESYQYEPYQYRGARAVNYMMKAETDSMENPEEQIAFKKIKITSTFIVKYEILNK